MDDAGTLERARSVLDAHRQWMQQHERSPVVLDAELESSAALDDLQLLSQRLPQATSSPATAHKPDLGKSKSPDQGHFQNSPIGNPSDKMVAGIGNDNTSSLSVEAAALGGVKSAGQWKHIAKPLHAWQEAPGSRHSNDKRSSDTSATHVGAPSTRSSRHETGDRLLGKKVTLNKEQPTIEFVELSAATDSVPWPQQRQAWSAANDLGPERQGNDKPVASTISSLPKDEAGDGDAVGDLNQVQDNSAAHGSNMKLSKHASRRQKQFRKRVMPSQDSTLAPMDSIHHSGSDLSPMASPGEDEARLLSLSTENYNDGRSTPPPSPDQSVAANAILPAMASTPSSESGESGLHTAKRNVSVSSGLLPPLARLPSPPDSQKPVRPTSPPSYFLPAHQQTRPLDMPALPCPLFGEYLEVEIPGKAFSTSKAAPSPPRQQGAPALNNPIHKAKPEDALIPPVHHAAWVGDVKRLRTLLQLGHSPDVLDNHGRTALMYSAHGTNIMCADVLLRHGAKLDHQANDGSSPLHEAAYVGSLSLIELMLHNGASPFLADNEGRLPMHYATYNKSEKCLIALLKVKNVNIDASDNAGMTSLMWAAYHERPAVCTLLLNSGADREEKDVDGRTAMHWAVNKSSVASLKLLLKHDMTYFKDHKGLTVLHIAAEKGSLRAARLILSLREDSVHDLDRQGRSPLHWAAVCSRVDVCALLLEFGASPNLKDKKGQSPLDYAKAKSLTYVIGLLTCFDWDSRPQLNTSSSRLTLLNRWSSRISPMPDSSGAPDSDSTSLASQQSSTSLASSTSRVSQAEPPLTLPDDYRKLLEDGTYMKVFTDNGKGPIQDKYFWVSLEQQQICWSKRRADRILGDYTSAKAVSVVAGVPDAVKERSDYMPDTKHKHSLTLTTTTIVMATLAYTPQHFKAWVTGFGGLLQGRTHNARSLSPLWAGDAWGAVNQRATKDVQALFKTAAKPH